MIILIEPAEARLSNPIAGLWRRLTGKERLSVSDDLVLGMKVLKMSVPMAAGGTERTRKKVLNTLRELRINTVLVREDFPGRNGLKCTAARTGPISWGVC